MTRSISVSIRSSSSGVNGAVDLEVVVEAVLDRRAEADAGARADSRHGRGEDVRGGVAEHARARRGRARSDLHPGVGFQWSLDIHHDAIDPRGDRRAGQAWADRLRELEDRRSDR
jgi:hypothetical protein